jgi:peptide chain release factor 3
VQLEPLSYQIARRTTAEHIPALNKVPGVEVLTSLDGDHFALFPDRWRLQRIERDHPEIVLDALAADSLG